MADDLVDALLTAQEVMDRAGVPRGGRRALVPPRRRPNLRWPTPPPHADPLDPRNLPGNLQIAWRFRVNGAWENNEIGDVMTVDVGGMDAASAAAVLEEAVAITTERFREALRDHVRTQVEIAERRTQAQPNRFRPNVNTMRQAAEQLFQEATRTIDDLTRERADQWRVQFGPAALRDLQQPPTIGTWLDEPREPLRHIDPNIFGTPRRPRPRGLHEAFQEDTK